MNHSKTTVDWLRFRAKSEPIDIIETIRPLYGGHASDIHLKHMDRGMLGFKQAAQIVMADMPIGRMDFGGESQRGWVRVDMTGKACEWVQDWGPSGMFNPYRGRDQAFGHSTDYMGW